MKGYTARIGLRKPEPPASDRLAKLMATIEAAAATLDGLPPELRRTMAHRTRVREAAGLVPVATQTFRAACPHCPCTYTTECCYCDGSRTPLEDS